MKTIAQELNVKEFPFTIKDSKGKIIYFEDSTGYWDKYEFDSNGNEIYYENSNEDIEDNRQKTTELTMDEIALKFNIKVEDLKIKKYR